MFRFFPRKTRKASNSRSRKRRSSLEFMEPKNLFAADLCFASDLIPATVVADESSAADIASETATRDGGSDDGTVIWEILEVKAADASTENSAATAAKTKADILIESRVTDEPEAPTADMAISSQTDPAEINGGLDRDIIRRRY